MKRFLLAAVMLAASFTGAGEPMEMEFDIDPAICYPSVFLGKTKHEYTITECVSLGSAVNIQNGMVMSRSSGKVEGDIVFNPRTGIVKFSTKKFHYKLESVTFSRFGGASLTSGKGEYLPGGGEVLFQIIENYRENSLNMVIRWPDYSSVRIIAFAKAD